jgi:TusA-related sulfurtransferase
MSEIEAEQTVDARSASCPGPLMDLMGAIRSADSGLVVRLLSDAEQSLTDVPEWTDQTDHDLIATEETDDHYEFYVRKA